MDFLHGPLFILTDLPDSRSLIGVLAGDEAETSLPLLQGLLRVWVFRVPRNAAGNRTDLERQNVGSLSGPSSMRDKKVYNTFFNELPYFVVCVCPHQVTCLFAWQADFERTESYYSTFKTIALKQKTSQQPLPKQCNTHSKHTKPVILQLQTA